MKKLVKNLNCYIQLEIVKRHCENPSRVHILLIDMANPLEAQLKLEEFLLKLEQGKIKEITPKYIDIFVQNAGVSMRVQMKDYCFENHLELNNINYNSPFITTQTMIGHFLKKNDIRGFRGQFVLISSASAKVAPALRSSYAGSKAAISALYDSLRTEISKDGIYITTIYPGYVQTNISKNSLTGKKGERFGKTDLNIQKGMSVETCCKECIFAIYRRDSEIIVTNQIPLRLIIIFRNVFTTLALKLMELNGKQQLNALLKAQ